MYYRITKSTCMHEKEFSVSNHLRQQDQLILFKGKSTYKNTDFSKDCAKFINLCFKSGKQVKTPWATGISIRLEGKKIHNKLLGGAYPLFIKMLFCRSNWDLIAHLQHHGCRILNIRSLLFVATKCMKSKKYHKRE